MDFSFEVRETDLMGRIGRLRVGGKELETPYLFPVIHPVSQSVPAREIASMGFGGVMTNAYIILTRRKEEATRRGLHDIVDFDGVLMTDSGGYQVLEYGAVDADYRDVAALQVEAGSELSVTLDRPTGFSATLSYARSTVEYSLKNAIATMREFGQEKTVWVGPVQGGLHSSLLRKSASSMVKAGYAYLALGSPVQVMENYMFRDLVSMVMATKRAIPYSTPLHLFGAGHPLTMALSVALGCDTFDSASYVLFARGGRYMTERGVLRIESMKFLPCSCPVCTRTSVAELQELEPPERTKRLAVHNLHILKKEVETCKESIAEGRLWDLVQEKASMHPRLFEAFRILGDYADLLGEGTPFIKDKGLFVRNDRDLNRPELVLSRARLGGAIRRSSAEAVLLTQELRKPALRGRGPRWKGLDTYRMHPVLGPYPAELEFVYPFTQTVVSSEAAPERLLKDSVKRLKGLGYRKVRVVKGGRRPPSRSRPKSRGSSPSVPSSSARPR